jgi:cytochrome b pre-mRNA-processing protein 3
MLGRLLGSFFGRGASQDAACALYDAAVAQARAPGFYTVGGAPDTLDGRFEMIALHVYGVLRRLKSASADNPKAARVAQGVFDRMFADLEMSLREMGASDIVVGDRVKEMARAFYGRIAAYDAGASSLADGDSGPLTDALGRNLFGTVTHGANVSVMVDYFKSLIELLDDSPASEILLGRVVFPDAPGAEGQSAAQLTPAA